MAAQKSIAGTAYIKVDSKQYTLGGSLTYSLNNVTRTGISGLSGVAGFTEAAHIPYIEGEFFTTEEFDIMELANITSATVTVELVNGKIISLEQAWQSGDIEPDASAGTCTIRFEGIKGTVI